MPAIVLVAFLSSVTYPFKLIGTGVKKSEATAALKGVWDLMTGRTGEIAHLQGSVFKDKRESKP